MPQHKFPPKGYKAMEYPLPHNFLYLIDGGMDATTTSNLILTLLRTSKTASAPETVEVNPANASFAEDTGPLVHLNSIVPRIKISMDFWLSKGARETDKLKSLSFFWFPIYIAFLDSLEAEDPKTNVQVEDILELTHNTDNEDVHPLHNGTDTGIAYNHPLSNVNATEVFGDYGLTTDAKVEFVTLDHELMKDAKQYYGNAGMLNKVMGRGHRVTLKADHPYRYFSHNYTYPSVKRGNPYTFCGIAICLPVNNTKGQINFNTEMTAIKHLHGSVAVEFDEWNSLFDQGIM